MAIGLNRGADGEFIAADDTAGRMKQVEVAGLFFGIKRTLNGEGTDMTTGGERCFPAEKLKAEVQRGRQPFLFCGNTVPCNVAPLQNQDKTAAKSIDRGPIIPVI